MRTPLRNFALWFACVLVAVSCNSRTKVEPCDFSYAVSCASYYTDQEEFQQCLETLGGPSCALSTEELADVNASIAAEIVSYTCSSSNSVVQSLEQDGVSVTHTPSTGATVYYVDQFHSPLTEYDNFVVAYTVSEALELVQDGETIVLCPSSYPENLEIADKNNITILNIAGGTIDMAAHTKITGELGSSIEINGAKGVHIKGLTLSGGNAGLVGDSGYGGGLFVSSFLDMEDANDRILIQNSFIEDNTALYDGGGVYVEGTVDVYFDNVSIRRNLATAGSGGGVAVAGLATDSKLVVCIECDLSQNSALFSGSAVSVTGQDAFVSENSKLQSNYPASDYSLSAVVLDPEAQFYALDLDFGSSEDSTENYHADVFLSESFENELLNAGSDAWDLFKVGSLTDEELQNILDEFTTAEGLLPGQYNYSGVLSVACHHGTLTDSCGEI